MEFMKFDADKCSLCGICVEKCPFGALTIEGAGIVVSESCRMCGLCVRNCPEKAIQFEQKAKAFNKDDWKNFLIYVEQERGEIHPVTYELVGEARKMAGKVGYEVNCVIVGGEGTKKNAEKLLPYGVDHVYVYEDPGFEGFRADCYADAVADCIAANKPSSVLIGATALGRSLAPRLSTRFHTGLTADCTTLDIKPNTDMIQVRPAFGGNIMAQIGITKSRPQFATVRYKVMDKAEVVANPHGEVVVCPVNEKMAESRIKILSSEVIDKVKSLEEEDVLVVAGRGVRNEKDVEMCRELAEALGGQLAFTRPMVENGFGDTAPGDCLILNDSRVLPARLLGQRLPGGGACEVLLLIDRGDKTWECLVRPGRKMHPGARLSFGNGELTAEIAGEVEGGNRLVRFQYDGIFLEVLERLGKMPLPPYIKEELADRERYQTVYSKVVGSAAAPTAGLHFTKPLLEAIAAKGVDIGSITLHVGLGTFRPVKEKNITDHEMHSEYCVISQETADLINRTKARGGRCVCVGTTSCRTLESWAREDGTMEAKAGWTDIYIYPGYKFKVMDALITNFHLPESTLIMLVSAFAGREHVLAAYEEAVRERYRFFSFGDAMLLY